VTLSPTTHGSKDIFKNIDISSYAKTKIITVGKRGSLMVLGSGKKLTGGGVEVEPTLGKRWPPLKTYEKKLGVDF